VNVRTAQTKVEAKRFIVRFLLAGNKRSRPFLVFEFFMLLAVACSRPPEAFDTCVNQAR
jgi:hypothetical protein